MFDLEEKKNLKIMQKKKLLLIQKLVVKNKMLSYSLCGNKLQKE